MEQKALRGEGRIASDGIYTPVHHYFSESGSEVILIGTVHDAEIDYFRAITILLDSCQSVIYEDPNLNLWEPEARAKNEARWRELLFSDVLDDAWIGASFAPMPQRWLDLLGLVLEWTSYDYSKKGWVAGDTAWVKRNSDSENQKEYWRLFRELSIAISPKRRWDLIYKQRDLFRKFDGGTLTRNDFLAQVLDQWTDEGLFILHHKLWTGERDEATFAVFDSLMFSQNSPRIGIKFGASHTAYQRKLIENRGYALKRSWWLKAVSIP